MISNKTVINIGDSPALGIKTILCLLSNREIRQSLAAHNLRFDREVEESLAYIVNHFNPSPNATVMQIFSYLPRFGE